jgi:alkanesulfonate monooxygenase SsuD/methylene tetrahydromethanopterin reductase-like flavin-dependent oxidoreductase (luciferase family)
MAQYRDAAEKQGWQASPDNLGWAVPCYVAETDEIAMREARPHAEAFYQKFLRMPTEMLLPPGYLSLKSMQGVMRAKAQMQGGDKSLEAVMKSGMFLCGSAKTVREQILRYQQEIGFGKILTMLQFATLPHDLAVKNMEIFARDVMGEIRKMGASPALATAK